MMTTHTPLPWKQQNNYVYGRDGISVDYVCLCSDDGGDHANAALIVRAVNCHAELLEACRKLAKLGDWTGATPPGFTAAWEAAVSAIAKASQ